MDEKKKISEVEVADHLEKFRAKQSGFLDTSFETISGLSSTSFYYLSQFFVCQFFIFPVRLFCLLLL